MTHVKMRKRSGSLLFDVILYIIAASVVIGGIYLSFSFLKGQADVSTLTNNDSKVLMDTATSFKTGYYKSLGKYTELAADSAKAWSPLILDSTVAGMGSFYKSSKFDNECKYYIGAHDYGTTVDARWGVYIDCSAAKANQNWSDEKTGQVELSFANSFKSRISGALIDGQAVASPASGAKFDVSTVVERAPNADGKLLIYNLIE